MRRLLMENKNCRYIDTVYGKGYRFCRPVVAVSRPTHQAAQCSIAVLPFHTHPQLDAISLHHSLVQCLSRYTPFGLIVLPATITQNCHDLSDIVALVEQLRPDYYLAGQTLPDGDGWKLRVELVRADAHQLVHQESIALSPEQPVAMLENRLASLLSQRIPGLNWNPGQLSELASLDTAIVYLNGRHELQQHTPSSLRNALILLRQCVSTNPGLALPYCSLAECYLTQSLLGLFDQQEALTQALQAISKAIDLEASHPQALGLLALLSSMRAQQVVADALLKQAWLLAPDSIDLYYYHAWHLFLCGDLAQAQRMLDACLQRDPSRIPAGILKLWVTYFEGKLNEAVALGKRQLSQYGQQHPVLQSVLALFLAMQGEHAQAETLIESVRNAGEDVGILAANHCYAEYCRQGEAALPAIQAFLARPDNRQLRPDLLPLYLALHGKEVTLQYWHQLEIENDPGLAAWSHDPRLAQLLSTENGSVLAAA